VGALPTAAIGDATALRCAKEGTHEGCPYNRNAHYLNRIGLSVYATGHFPIRIASRRKQRLRAGN
jgi:hypothetical protein